MKKTSLRLNEEFSIMILSLLSMLFSFLSSYSPIGSLISFLFVFFKSFIFIVVPLLFYIIEKECGEFKKIAGVYASYFIINLFITIIVSISMVNGITVQLWKTLFDLVNLIILLSSLSVFVEKVLDYSGIKSKVYSNIIMRAIYFVGDLVSYPFLIFINNKIIKKRDDK